MSQFLFSPKSGQIKKDRLSSVSVCQLERTFQLNITIIMLHQLQQLRAQSVPGKQLKRDVDMKIEHDLIEQTNEFV